MKWLRRLMPGLLLGIVVVVGYSHSAYGYFGRANNHGYLTDQNAVGYDWTFVPFPPANYDGLGPGCDIQCNMNLPAFLATFNARLNDPDPIDSGRAAALIDIMLGQPGSNFTSIAQGVAYAKVHYQQWVDLMTIYDQGSVPGYTVNWNDYLYFPVGVNGMGMQGVPSGADIVDCTNGQQCIGDVVVSSGFTAAGFDYAVVFNGPNGEHFDIKHKCANLTGDSNPLPIPNSQVVISKTSDSPSPVTPGAQVTYTLDVHELAPIPLSNVTISDTIPPEFKYIGVAPGTPAPTVSGNQLTWNFSSPADSAVLANIANGSEKLNIVVQAVATGNGIVNTATGTAVNEFGQNETVIPGQTLNVVNAPSAPIFTGTNSDVHAGGGLCGQTLTDGRVQGNLTGAAKDQYVVSASALDGINDFGSRNAKSGTPGDVLKLGQTGEYAQICRSDLVASVALPYFQAHPGDVNVISGTDFDLTGKPEGAYYFMPSSTLAVHGTVSAKITIVALSGNVEITGTILSAGSKYASRQIPSLGIITKGDINISGSAVSVDAFLFADGTIDTCVEANSACLNTLSVNGFLMAKNIMFRRLGPANSSGAVVGEQVRMSPDLYLNPPLLFDNSGDGTIYAQGLGEKQPLF